MRSHIPVPIAVALFLSCAQANAQTPDCSDLQSSGIPGQLYLWAKASSDPQVPARWMRAPETIPGNATLNFAYLIPGGRQPRSGAVIVKVARSSSQPPTPESAVNLRVSLSRAAVPTTCYGRYASDHVVRWFRDVVRLQVQTSVPVADYIYYHKTDSDAGQPDLHRFHFEYRDTAGRCKSTDDKDNGNRQQFLFEKNPQRDNSLVLANIKNNLARVAEAFGAPDYVGHGLRDKGTENSLKRYQKYSNLETRLYEYKHPGSACVAFSLADALKGEDIVLTFNDLEYRKNRARIEKSVTIKVR